MHKISAQLSEEGISLPLSRVLAEATYAGNALTSIRGVSPYTAVLGRVPPLLPDPLAITDDTEGHQNAQHTHRLREIAIQCIVEASAQDRLKRASHTLTKPAGEEWSTTSRSNTFALQQARMPPAGEVQRPSVICQGLSMGG